MNGEARNAPGGRPPVPPVFLPDAVTVDGRRRPFEPYRHYAQAGDDVELRLDVPHAREYSIQIFGDRGAAMTLFEDVGGEIVHYADDERSNDLNAALRVRLEHDRRYVLRLCICFGQASRDEAVMRW